MQGSRGDTSQDVRAGWSADEPTTRQPGATVSGAVHLDCKTNPDPGPVRPAGPPRLPSPWAHGQGLKENPELTDRVVKTSSFPPL